MFKFFIVLGAANASLAVILGAFGAHGLQDKLPSRMLEVFQTGVQYHFYHALGIVLVAILADKFPQSDTIHWAGWIMLLGIVLFSGSLYALSISGITKLGIITPFGGVAFIISWILVIIAALKG